MARHYGAEAEEAYRLSSQLWPANPEAHLALANLYAESGRKEEAQAIIENFMRQHPDQAKHIEGRGPKMTVTFEKKGP